MKKISKKNKSFILLILAIIFIMGSWYFYKILLPGQQLSESEELIKSLKINKTKVLIQENVDNFIKKDSFQELANNKQYQELEEVSDFLNLDTGVGNSDPFYNPSIIIVE